MMYFGGIISPPGEIMRWMLVGSQSNLLWWWISAPEWRLDAYGPSVLLAAKQCSPPGKAASSLSAYLGSHVRKNAALQSHFRGTLITRVTHLNWREHCTPPPPVPLSLTCLKTDSAEEFSVFCSEKWKSVSERWSRASKGKCNWAALDRLSRNMKRQQLWRRVIASQGSYNALSSL